MLIFGKTQNSGCKLNATHCANMATGRNGFLIVAERFIYAKLYHQYFLDRGILNCHISPIILYLTIKNFPESIVVKLIK